MCGPRSRLQSLRRSSIHTGTTKATLVIILILLLMLMMMLLLMLMLIIIAHSGEPRISVGPELRSRLRRGCLCGGLLRVRCSCHILLRVIIRRRLLVVVVVVVRGRHLARIEAYLTPIAINNAMAPGGAGAVNP